MRFSNATLLPLLSLLVLGLGTRGAAQAPALHIERRGALQLEVDPGDVVTAPFRLSNRARVIVVAEVEVVLPPRWRSATPLPALELVAGGNDLQLVSIAVPRDAPAGRYVVRLRAPHAGDSVIVKVRERRLLEVFRQETPAFVVAGEPYTTRFTLVNRGNAPAQLRLRAHSSLGLSARLDSASFVLPVGGSREITVLVPTERSIRRQMRDLLELRAGRPGLPDSALASTMMEIIPRGGGHGLRFRTFPVVLGLRVTESGSVQAPAMVAGAGPLAHGDNTQLEFLFRRARPASALMNERDEYRVALRGKGFDIRLGDHVYALSPLTEPGRGGFGAAGALRLGRWSGGTLVRWDRWGFDADSMAGGFLGFRVAPAAHVQVHYLHIRNEGQSDVWTGRGQFAVFRHAALDLEYGIGTGALGRGTAHSVGFSGSVPVLSWAVRHVRADRAYPLTERTLPADAASVTLRPWGGWRIEGTWNAANRELLSLAPFVSATVRTRHSRVGLAYRSAFTLEYKQNELEVEGVVPAPSRQARTVALRFAPRFGRVTVSPGGEMGVVVDRRTGEETAFQRTGLQASVALRSGDWISASIERRSGGPALGSRDPLSASLNASVRLTPLTWLRVSTSRTLYDGLWEGAYQSVEAVLEQKLPLGHRLITRLRTFSSGAAPAAQPPAFQVEYEIPLRIPVARLKASGSVEGRVFDVQTGRGLADVPIRLGDQVIMSDKRGRVIFSSLKSGHYDLQFDQQAVGANRVPRQGTPRAVTVDERGTARFAVGFVAASRLLGSVVLLELPLGGRTDTATAGAQTGGPLHNVVVTISAPGEVHRRVSDALGRFDFSGLPAGRWRLEPAPGALPPHHVWEEEALDIELGPGEQRELLLKVIPKNRPMRLVAEADLAAPPGKSAAVKPAPLAATPSPSSPVHLYMTHHQDRTLADVARRVYGDGSLWPKLWLANQTRLGKPDRLPVGVALTIPPRGPLSEEEQTAARAFPSIR